MGNERVRKFDLLRKSFQLIFLLYVIFVSLGHAFNWSFGESLHSICPFGAVETMHSWVTTGKFLHHTGQGNVYIVVGLVLTLVFVGAFFCGWICPFGSTQEFIGKLGQKIFKSRYNNIIPVKLDNALRYVKYLFLLFVLFQTSRMFTLVFENLDPYYTLFNIWSDEIAISAYIILTVFLLLSLITERPYCKYMCPLGAINGLFNSFSLFNIKRDTATCINCSACDKVCPMKIDVSSTNKVNNTKCLRCMKCVSACPVNDKSNTLKFKLAGKNSKVLNKKNILIASLLLFLIPIIVGMNVNAFEEDMSDKKYETANDIRGSYTIHDITKHYKINKKELIHAFGIENNETQKINVLLESQGISLEILRSVIDGFDKPAGEVIINLPKKYDSSISLRKLINSEETAVIVKLMKNEHEEETTNAGIELKRKSMLVDIKNNVKDYDDFLMTFGISKDKSLNTNFRELIDEYGFSMQEVRDYVTENKK